MGISCSCFSRFEHAFSYSDESPEEYAERMDQRGRRISAQNTSSCLDTILETSERASSAERKKSDEARLSEERRRSQENRKSNEKRRSHERRSSGERLSNERRRSTEQQRRSMSSSEGEETMPTDEEMLRAIFEHHKIRSPQQATRLLAALRAPPGQTPVPAPPLEADAWLNTLTPQAPLTGEQIAP